MLQKKEMKGGGRKISIEAAASSIANGWDQVFPPRPHFFVMESRECRLSCLGGRNPRSSTIMGALLTPQPKSLQILQKARDLTSSRQNLLSPLLLCRCYHTTHVREFFGVGDKGARQGKMVCTVPAPSSLAVG